MSRVVPYVRPPLRVVSGGGPEVASFVSSETANLDAPTVQAFGEEWQRFSSFGPDDLRSAGEEYFDLVTPDMVPPGSVALDIGCGTGRWSVYLSPRVDWIEAVDPSAAVLAAARFTSSFPNIRVTQAGYGSLPFRDESFDFVFSLGVVHHLPDPQGAISDVARMVRPGGWVLLYIYYALENRTAVYRALFGLVNAIRRVVSALPSKVRFLICDLLAAVLYVPSILAVRTVRRFLPANIWTRLPLAYYADKSWRVIRNDALDRFGTPLEKRFSRDQIRGFLEQAGLVDITFSEKAPYWHCVARKP